MKNRIWKTTGVVLATVCSLLIGSGNRIQGAEAGNYGYEATAVQDEEQGTGNSSEDFEIKDEEISGSDEVELPEASVFLETAAEEELQETEETEETPAVSEEKDDSVNPDVTETPDFLDQEESTVLPGCKMWINPEQEQIKAGKELLYTVKIENTGNCTLYNIHLGASFSEKSLKGIWEKAEGAVVQEETLKLDFLETGMQKEVYLSVQIPEAQSGKLSLNIEGKAEYEQNGEKQILSVEESRETEILPLKADFRVTKTADRTRAVPGDEIVFQICIQNTGERTLHSVVTTEKFRLKNVPVKFLEGEGLTLNKDRTKARIEKIDPGYFVGLLAIVTLPEDIDDQKLINEVTVTTAETGERTERSKAEIQVFREAEVPTEVPEENENTQHTETKGKAASTHPKTGDPMKPVLWLLVISGSLLAAGWVYSRMRNQMK